MIKKYLNTIAKKLCFAVFLVSLALMLIFGLVLYPVIYNVLKENAIVNVQQISKQSVDYIDNVMAQYEQYSRFMDQNEYLYNLLINDPIGNKNTAEMNLSNSMNYFSNISNVFLILEDSTIIKNVGNDISDQTIMESEWYQTYKKNQYSRHFSNTVDNQGNSAGSREGIGYLFVVYPYQNKELKGDLVLLFPFFVFEEALQTYEQNGMDVILFNRYDMPIYKTENSEIAFDIDKLKIHLPSTDSSYQKIFDSDTGISFIGYSKTGGWKLVVHASDGYIAGSFQNSLYFLYIIVAINSALFILLILVLISRRLKPLKSFTKKLNEITEDNLNVRVDMPTGDELEELAGSFNKMVVRIQQYVDDKIEQNAREKQMEHALVIAQINPHFIYKTLSIITFLARNNRSEELIAVNKSLVSILTDRLRISQVDQFDTAEKEIEVIEAYLTIQRIRYGAYIQFEKKISDDALQEQIPKNIIQPLVENALFHGLLLNEDDDNNIVGGIIELSFVVCGDEIEIKVTDNGPGMSQENIEKYFSEHGDERFDRGRHIGIRNIRDRLSFLYGTDYTFKALSSDKVGTQVIIKIKRRGFDEEA